MSNPNSHHSYFGWPTAARLQYGKIAVVASGCRRRHICPFGKAVISYSEDDGKTYTAPAPIIDTTLDDRDGGIMTFGESGVIVTSFNNLVSFQKGLPYADAYDHAYLDTVTPEEEERDVGSTFRISYDYGVTFGEMFKAPVTSPHGPMLLKDGSILWIGRTFDKETNEKNVFEEYERVAAYKINLDGTSEFVGAIDNVIIDGVSPLLCEPHAIVLDDGTILVHIRAQHLDADENVVLFTVLQSESHDNGKTWSTPTQILPRFGGSPAHLFRHSSGLLICTYGFVLEPFGVGVMFSHDEGETWDIGHRLYLNKVSNDCGYPTTVELQDGSLLTVFYGTEEEGAQSTVKGQKWRFEE
jgi:hypothetical protein